MSDKASRASATNTKEFYLEEVVLKGLKNETRFGSVETDMTFDPKCLFDPIDIGPLRLENRIVMAPMTRGFSADRIPGDDVAAYYRRRAEGGAGLIITEGTYVPHDSAGFYPGVPCFHGEALHGWKKVVEQVHAVGGRIFPQLWHVGLMPMPGDDRRGAEPTSPSGLFRAGECLGIAAGSDVLEKVVLAFGDAAASAMHLGCDGVQVHGAHGYLIDQFLWDATNKRTDRFGGPALPDRSQFALEILKECRRRTKPDFPISFRYSQWKQQDFSARLAQSPQELEAFLIPLCDAGVDIFDCSTRRFWVPEFQDSDLNLAGWTKKITGKISTTVGSISLSNDNYSSMIEKTHVSNNLHRLVEMMERGDFDLIAVGRAMISDPDWANKIKDGDAQSLAPYDVGLLESLV